MRDLTDHELEMVATSLGKTCTAISRRAERTSGEDKAKAKREFGEHEALRREFVDEQERRFKTSA